MVGDCRTDVILSGDIDFSKLIFWILVCIWGIFEVLYISLDDWFNEEDIFEIGIFWIKSLLFSFVRGEKIFSETEIIGYCIKGYCANWSWVWFWISFEFKLVEITEFCSFPIGIDSLITIVSSGIKYEFCIL